MKPTREQVERWADRVDGGKDDRLFTYTQDWLTEFAAIAFAAGQASNVPEGWKLVPVEPTYEMKKAAWDDYESDSHTGVESWWKAMLAAAPSQETGE